MLRDGDLVKARRGAYSLPPRPLESDGDLVTELRVLVTELRALVLVVGGSPPSPPALVAAASSRSSNPLSLSGNSDCLKSLNMARSARPAGMKRLGLWSLPRPGGSASGSSSWQAIGLNEPTPKNLRRRRRQSPLSRLSWRRVPFWPTGLLTACLPGRYRLTFWAPARRCLGVLN